MPRIIMRRGPDPGKIYPVEGDTVKIGRGRRNDVIIHDNEVSREHCILTKSGEYYVLKDAGSSNGTFVNGQRVDDDGWVLKSDCIIEIGDSITLEFVTNATQFDVTEAPIVHPYLIVFINSAEVKPQVYPLDGDTVTLGRDLSSTIVIQEPEVSRQHLQFHFSDAGYMAQDLGSTNGTMVNGELLDATRLLRLNDILQIGTMVKLLYTDDPAKFISDSQTDLLPTMPDDDDTVNRNVIGNSEMLEKIKLRTETSELGMGFKPGSLVGHILIVYARADWTAVVAKLYSYLEDRKFQVWVDQYLTHGQEDWATAFDHVLSECSALVVVVSQAALDTDHVKRAWRYFRSREKPIILVMYENVDNLPMELRKVATIDYNEKSPDDSHIEVAAELMRLGV